MRAIGITFLFALLLLGLGAYVVQVVPEKIETSIATDIKNKFTTNNLSQISISMNGRDVNLAGSVDSQAQIDLAMKLASHNAGVRSVMTTMVVVAEDTTSSNESSPDKQ